MSTDFTDIGVTAATDGRQRLIDLKPFLFGKCHRWTYPVVALVGYWAWSARGLPWWGVAVWFLVASAAHTFILDRKHRG